MQFFYKFYNLATYISTITHELGHGIARVLVAVGFNEIDIGNPETAWLTIPRFSSKWGPIILGIPGTLADAANNVEGTTEYNQESINKLSSASGIFLNLAGPLAELAPQYATLATLAGSIRPIKIREITTMTPCSWSQFLKKMLFHLLLLNQKGRWFNGFTPSMVATGTTGDGYIAWRMLFNALLGQPLSTENPGALFTHTSSLCTALDLCCNKNSYFNLITTPVSFLSAKAIEKTGIILKKPIDQEKLTQWQQKIDCFVHAGLVALTVKDLATSNTTDADHPKLMIAIFVLPYAYKTLKYAVQHRTQLKNATSRAWNGTKKLFSSLAGAFSRAKGLDNFEEYLESAYDHKS